MNICVQVEYFVHHKGQDIRSAIATVLSGTSEGMRRWSYGDDNRVFGTEREVEQFIGFMSTVFDIEEDPTPKYLGTVYRADMERFLLPAATYNTKLYLPERDYDWKDYPHLGMVERRSVFEEYGEPEIAKDIIPFENDLWARIDFPFQQIVSQAVKERLEANKKGVHLSSLQLTDKEYLMTEQERIASGLFWHLKPDVTGSIANQIVGNSDITALFTFRNAPKVLAPRPTSTIAPYRQGGDDNLNDDVILSDDGTQI